MAGCTGRQKKRRGTKKRKQARGKERRNDDTGRRRKIPLGNVLHFFYSLDMY